MIEYLSQIDAFLNKKIDFWTFYNWFQEAYFSDEKIDVRQSFRSDEISLLQEINNLLAYAGVNPTQEERDNGIMDKDQFGDRLLSLKKNNIVIWKRSR
jgi:hypothetical protein